MKMQYLWSHFTVNYSRDKVCEMQLATYNYKNKCVAMYMLSQICRGLASFTEYILNLAYLTD